MRVKLWRLSTEAMVYIVEKGENAGYFFPFSSLFSNAYTPKGSPEKRITILVKGRNRREECFVVIYTHFFPIKIQTAVTCNITCKPYDSLLL